MRKFIISLFLVTLLGRGVSYCKLDCVFYHPTSVGTLFELKNYNEKDKLESTIKHKVVEKKTQGNSVLITGRGETFDKKGKTISSFDYSVKCEKGIFLMDMRNLISPEQMKSMQNMEVAVEGDFLDYPPNPALGQKLKDGSITFRVIGKGPVNIGLTSTVSNRMVEGLEKITTPAGTFQCVKISSDVESKMLFSFKYRVVQWFAENVGMVRSETYDTKGKLKGYSVLTELKT